MEEPSKEPSKEPESTPKSTPTRLFKNKWARIAFVGMAGLILVIWAATVILKP